MIDQFAIVHRGGVVLWERTLTAMSTRPIDHLIQHVLMEERSASTSHRFDKYTLKWCFANEHDLVFIAVYLNLSSMLYIDELLDAVRNDFCATYGNAIAAMHATYPYAQRFERVLAGFEQQQRASGGGGSGNSAAASGQSTRRPMSYQEAKQQRANASAAAEPAKPSSETTTDAAPADGDATAASSTETESTTTDTTAPPTTTTTSDSSSSTATAAPSTTSTTSAPTFNPEKLRQLQSMGSMRAAGRPMRTGPPAKKKQGGGGGSIDASATAASPSSTRSGKAPTVWDNTKVSKQEAAELDYASKIGGGSSSSASSGESQVYSSMGDGEAAKKARFDDDDDDDANGAVLVQSDDENDDDDSAPSSSASSSSLSTSKPASSSGLFGFFKSLVGQKELTRSDLDPVLTNFKQSLMAKNVAQEIAEKLCESVCVTLEGKKLGSFTSIATTVRDSIDGALTRILTSGPQTDVLQGILNAKAQRRPYSIVFLGVNGVGKSTSLAKTCAYFMSKGLKVGIAACDTFRAGAIEQLRTHATALNVPLYAKGYDRDAATVCRESIETARREGMDVVLVDTAGRMPDNEALMRALSKLIHLNNPDLILFVGEALVGNDAVDQAAKFNRCLSDLSGDSEPRLIDGIILTKFDTVDDKVGAAISMAYTTGRPIMFVGTGQTYTDLKRMNVKTLVNALLK